MRFTVLAEDSVVAGRAHTIGLIGARINKTSGSIGTTDCAAK